MLTATLLGFERSKVNERVRVVIGEANCTVTAKYPPPATRFAADDADAEADAPALFIFTVSDESEVQIEAAAADPPAPAALTAGVEE